MITQLNTAGVFAPSIVLLCRILIGLLFTITAILKIKDLRGFYLIFLQYGIFAPKIAKPLAYTQPFIELITGILILANQKILFYSSLAALGLLAVATFFVAYGYAKQLKMKNCGCYGTAIKSPLSAKKIAENILWIIIIAYVFLSTI